MVLLELCETVHYPTRASTVDFDVQHCTISEKTSLKMRIIRSIARCMHVVFSAYSAYYTSYVCDVRL